ncbi:MAG: hypothetical protein Greene041614_1020 [Parcubacteria group bacterium Greene0416_14]|nr:MAG: hypothetical protein Greene041614_1020 [Parcubacteria group bacterium Greene0416_14]TSC99804.1 MAG: hypothetical protein Greene101415_1087 [Parcubacteria group bacterium Greene1014_15]TSD07843.1 MAG: hypothetical protein Greene07144_677 [Parcubacteria group bacterium Greene0714_4]
MAQAAAKKGLETHAQYIDFGDKEIVFDLRRMGASAPIARALILGEISAPEFGDLRERVRFVE